MAYIRREGLLHAGDRLGIAVSGGADSVALLRIMLELRPELGIVLSVVHFNHQLRGAESEGDEKFVTRLAQQHELPLHIGRGDVAAHARGEQLSTEAAARQLRYQYFRELFAGAAMNRIATGHTVDDQAETVLLRIVRGAGTRGLAGIYPELVYLPPGSSQLTGAPLIGTPPVAPQFFNGRPIENPLIKKQLLVDGSQFSVIRPLLRTRRKALEEYLKEVGQEWREDSSNRDLRHARNRVRHGILPRLERSLNPAVRETLGETADLARAEEEYWQQEVVRVLPGLWRAKRRTFSLAGFDRLALALRRRLVRAAAESLGLRLEFRHVEEILGLKSRGPRSAMLPEGWQVSVTKDGLQFNLAALPEAPSSGYEYNLAVSGAIRVGELGARFEAVLVPGSATAGYNPDHMLDPALLRKDLTLRNWRAGDRYWPAHRKSPKKIKELLQERKLTGTERKLWPVVTSGQEIVWVKGFPVPAHLRPQEGAPEALVIRELTGPEDLKDE